MFLKEKTKTATSKFLLEDGESEEKKLHQVSYIVKFIDNIQIFCPTSTAQVPGAVVRVNSPRLARRFGCFIVGLEIWCCRASS